ncbi:MAG: transcription-repair coupling factor [Chromatiales bacterium]|jgi:transcription-repair coupling factor (superfamily II helicase)
MLQKTPFEAPYPAAAGERLQWGNTLGGSLSLSLAHVLAASQQTMLMIAPDVQTANRWQQEAAFFSDGAIDAVIFPDQETLPYDIFSPLPELTSQRLLALHQISQMQSGLVIVPISTLLQKLPPLEFIENNALILEVGQQFDLDSVRQRLQRTGYQNVSQVLAHGEYAIRGSLIDIFPMGSELPLRIDLFDDEIDSIRTFDTDNQRSLDKVDSVRLLPAREFPTDEESITRFRQAYREKFAGDPQRSLIYRDVSDGIMTGGLEYYLPLFFEQTASLFDYLPKASVLVFPENYRQLAEDFLKQVEHRYEQRRHDTERPLLVPDEIYLNSDALAASVKAYAAIMYSEQILDSKRKGFASFINFSTEALPPLNFNAKAKQPAQALQHFLTDSGVRVLFTVESPGRREMLRDSLQHFGIDTSTVDGWQAFLGSAQSNCLAVTPIETGLWLPQEKLCVIPEALLLGEKVRQERRQRREKTDAELVIRNLTELHPGTPVVHEEHGIGRYLGLQKLDVGDNETEFLTLEYAKGDKLYVPVASLHLISRYTGANEDTAPLHTLGSGQWEKAKRKAIEKVRDVAAELLDIYARRATHTGYRFKLPQDEYEKFAADFAFEETPDQQSAIEAVIRDMTDEKPMDRVVCGDVGFGKTEVAMRAAFVAAINGKQVAVIAPTTLLAQQHLQNFADRFADWPVKVEGLSRFKTAKQTTDILGRLKQGKVDIVVGTHKLLSSDVKFSDLGLVIIDEEHRFGVRQKEQLKSLRSEVDILTLTATPIPRTLNMAMSGMRDLSIIATPPAARHPIQTFVSQWNDNLIVEACEREIKRGGQIYFLHNEVSTIENTEKKLQELLPQARIRHAHGQMRETELEAIMRDFYHQRFNLLVCTTIVESGIDVPSANTIIMDRADKLGLAQMHQLRGRVGRSHHRAYAYLITPPPKTMTANAVKRLAAIESMEDLGAGFTLATHDLEIRGAGELLGDEQSGQIHEIGFTLYTELLERAVKALKSGKQPELDRPLDHGTEIDLQLPAILPDDYLPDVHSRLVMYKRIASCATRQELRDLQVEMIDRFGLLPPAAKNLFAITELKLKVHPLGIRKIEAGVSGGRFLFEAQPKIDPMNIIQLIQKQPKRFQLDGADRLKFSLDLEDRDSRIHKVATLVDQLTGKNEKTAA